MAVDAFSFILTPINLSVELDVEITDAIYISRATDTEAEMLRAYVLSSPNLYARALYESNLSALGARESTLTYLDRSDWRYFVLRFCFEDQMWDDLTRILHIAKKDLRVGPGFHYPTPDLPGIGKFKYLPPTYETYWMHLRWLPKPLTVNINEDEINEYRDLYGLYKQHAKKFPWLDHTLQMFCDLDGIPSHDRLYSLGLFTVLEALITHPPGERETGDSVSRQLRTKMLLLEHRIDIRLDQTVFGGEITQKNLWGKLYKFRSKIAHGGNLDFASGDLAALRSIDTINEFLRITIKALIRGALNEPRLYQDLKEC